MLDRIRQISIHAPHAGSDCQVNQAFIAQLISIHAPHAGSDAPPISRFHFCVISIHAPHAGSDPYNEEMLASIFQISIHAPHAGSDRAVRTFLEPPADFNPRSPCGERRNGGKINGWNRKFQSTLPMRGATYSTPYNIFTLRISIHAPHAGSDSHSVSFLSIMGNFNPRSPCGERLS